ncbi:hypothetical protein [Nannocystis pusilla]|uniref:SMI1/KNR4 family protein n=1 Tax=Nannocystis pusilla TaxID=889268 RepID=A0ABS7U475_9BACT|nr:hypothetical protein [Nannocystis pusilla]MBZ5715105.1 hypothetical protein [Nannocystis pusilla]
MLTLHGELWDGHLPGDRGFADGYSRPRMDGLPLPPLLQTLLDSGRWPRTASEALRQNSAPRASQERVRALAPEEDGLYLAPPPFATVRSLMARQPFWSDPEADPRGIDPDLALVLGDFGLGSDAPILLDYRLDARQPRVLRLRWSWSEGNRWIVAAPDFAGFAAALGL